MEENLQNAPENEEKVEEVALADRVKVVSPAALVLKRFFRSKLSIIGLVIILFMFFFSFLGPLFTGWEENEIDTNMNKTIYTPYYSEDGEMIFVDEFLYNSANLEVPFSVSGDGRVHVLGTDKNGMDVFTRLMYGGRISLTLSLLVVFINTFFGIIIGGLAGYIGKWLDMVVMRLIDVIDCVPQLPIMLIISAILTEYGVDKSIRIYIMMGVLTLISWTGIARLVRGQILYLREQEFIIAAEAGGFSTARKVFRHLVPNIVPQLIVSMSLSFGGMILFETTLSYLDLGIQEPNASWGKMVNLAKDPEILSKAPYVWLSPGICIILAVLGFNFLGDGLRDAFDPKMKR